MYDRIRPLPVRGQQLEGSLYIHFFLLVEKKFLCIGIVFSITKIIINEIIIGKAFNCSPTRHCFVSLSFTCTHLPKASIIRITPQPPL